MKDCENACNRKFNPSQKNKINYHLARELWECKSSCDKKNKKNNKFTQLKRKNSIKKRQNRKRSHKKKSNRRSKTSFFNFF